MAIDNRTPLIDLLVYFLIKAREGQAIVKFIPYEKLSKRKQRQINAGSRNSWGALSPVTRKAPNPKAYKREKSRNWGDEPSRTGFFTCPMLIKIILIRSLLNNQGDQRVIMIPVGRDAIFD